MEDIYSGYAGESEYRKNLISHISHTRYENLKEICSGLNYAFSTYDLIRLAEGYKNGNNSLKEKIEYILTDCNFHSECSLLEEGKADEFIKNCKRLIEEDIEKNVLDIFEREYLENRADSFIPANSDLLKECTIQELYYLVDKGFIQVRDCDALAFELTDEHKKVCDMEQLKSSEKRLDYVSYKRIINTALENTSSGNWRIDLVNEYGLNKSEIKDFQEFLSQDERVSDIEWSNGNTEVDIIFYLKYCPNAEEDEYDESKYTEIDAKNPLLKGWKWGYFNDGSGSLISPSGKEYFIFDWSTKEYKTYKDSPWDLHHDDITGKSDFKSFEKYAEDYAVENLLKLEDSIENKNDEEECL